MAETQTSNSHVVMLPSPGMGHLLPFIEFAKRLIHLHRDFHVTCVIPTVGPPTNAVKASVESLPPSISHTFVPPVDSDDGSNHTDLMQLAVTRSLPVLRDLLKTSTNNDGVSCSVVFLADFFSIEAFDVAREVDVPAYVFFPSGAMTLSLCSFLPKLEEMFSSTTKYKNLSEPIKIPGCIPLQGRDLPDPVLNRESGKYKWFLEISKRLRLSKGIAVNTFFDIEAGPLKALMEAKETEMPPVYPVGPLVRTESEGPIDDGSESNCLRWLNNQPRGSVLFVSFGSGGTLSRAQLTELAFGLEMSGQRFIWVVRKPSDESAAAAFFDNKSQFNPLDILPEGFLDRTKENGFVIPSWAPQTQILSHGSTGGFLTHCGWNSTLESFVSGVPLIAWPLYAEQKMNAVLLTEDVKVALRPKVNENGLIVREEISKVIKELMEGGEGKVVRDRMRELKIAGEKALAEDGSSTKALSKLAFEWKNNKIQP